MIIKQELSSPSEPGKKLSFFGISAKGEAHLKLGKPNQDAIGYNSLDDSFVLAVSDGLGSCERSQIGAQKAVSLCNDIFIEIADAQLPFKAESIMERLINLWNESFPALVAKEYSATLKAVFFRNNELIALSVGDGLLFVRANNIVHAIETVESGFVNETACLSNGMRLNVFKTIRIEKVQNAFVFMCTDGVSNSISEGREQEMFEKIATLEDIHELRADMESMLSEMSEYNSDDKTLGLVKYEP
jgi:serine/threonine protein phosphatase PrpC